MANISGLADGRGVGGRRGRVVHFRLLAKRRRRKRTVWKRIKKKARTRIKRRRIWRR